MFTTAVPSARTSRMLAAAVALLVCLLPVRVASARVAPHPPLRPYVAKVGYIYLGLAVLPPHKSTQPGRVKMSLYNQYGLHTDAKQKASIRFRDGTTLHMNQRTDAVLQSPHRTYVRSGEVNEIVKPGTKHQIQTATAVAAAIGTRFDVKIRPHRTIFIVVEGAVLVRNKKGSVLVKTNQETIVRPNQPPSPPQHVDAAAATRWTDSLPSPNLGENVALDANGGKVVDVSSQYTSATQGDFWDAKFINDGRLDFGWESGTGQVSDQWVKIGFFKPDGSSYTATLTAVIIDPTATHGDPPEADLKDFEVRVSTTGTADADFHTVLTGTCQEADSLQTFTLSSPANAKYVELFARTNYGSPDWVNVAEFEAIGSPKSTRG